MSKTCPRMKRCVADCRPIAGKIADYLAKLRKLPKVEGE